MRILTQDGSTVRPASFFDQFAKQAERSLGHPMAFVIAVGAIVLWAVSGPFFHYSDTWQLVINTATTIVTFLMVFLIQNSQNRDSAAIQVKLDELIRVGRARNSLVGIERLTEEELEDIRRKCESRAQEPTLHRNAAKNSKARKVAAS